MTKAKHLTATTPDGHKVGWDICGNPSCNRHMHAPAPGCPNHPVQPAYLGLALPTRKRAAE